MCVLCCIIPALNRNFVLFEQINRLLLPIVPYHVSKYDYIKTELLSGLIVCSVHVSCRYIFDEMIGIV